jgi:hypothetical protein
MPVPARRRRLVRANDPVLDRQLLIRRDDVDMVGLDLDRVLDLHDRHFRAAGEQLGQMALLGRIEVRRDDEDPIQRSAVSLKHYIAMQAVRVPEIEPPASFGSRSLKRAQASRRSSVHTSRSESRRAGSPWRACAARRHQQALMIDLPKRPENAPVERIAAVGTELAHGQAYRPLVTRQITSPTSSATSTEPSGPIATPTGRP